MFFEIEGKRQFENIFINIVCSKVLLKECICLSVTAQIEMLGIAINRAKKLLLGQWILRQDGYLERVFLPELPRKDINIDIAEDDNAGVVELLCRVDLKEIMSHSFSGTIAHFHYDNAVADYIIKDEKGLYLKSQKELFDFKRELQGIETLF